MGLNQDVDAPTPHAAALFEHRRSNAGGRLTCHLKSSPHGFRHTAEDGFGGTSHVEVEDRGHRLNLAGIWPFQIEGGRQQGRFRSGHGRAREAGAHSKPLSAETVTGVEPSSTHAAATGAGRLASTPQHALRKITRQFGPLYPRLRRCLCGGSALFSGTARR